MQLTKKIYGLDKRSIDLFRVMLGSVFIAHMVGYVLMNFGSMFSPETGVLGNGFAKEYIANYNGPEWLFAIDTDAGMLGFISVRLLFMIAFTIGIYPRVSAFVSALLLWFFQIRYNVLFLGWEMFAAVLISWSVFLPWNRPDGEEKSNEWRSPLAFVFLFQLGFIYFYNGVSKNGDKWMDGTAVKFFFAELDKTRPLANLVIDQDWLTSSLTYYTLFMEVIVLVLLLIPWKSVLFRYISILMIITLHWGIDLFVNVGFFKWYALCIGVVLLPGSFWVSMPLSVQQFIQKLQPIRSLSIPSGKVAKYGTALLASYLLFMIVETNLFQTVTSKTNDRVGSFLRENKLDKPVKNLMPEWWPQYSFLRQFWHLYSPNPPSEKGHMQLEFITDGGVSRVSQGKPLAVATLYSSNVEQHLMMYLTLRQVRNKREQIALKAKIMHEINLWNRGKSNPSIKQVEVVVYSFKPEFSNQITRQKPEYTRQVLQTIDIDYGKQKSRSQ